MGQVHHRMVQVSLDDILQTSFILLVSGKTVRNETIKEEELEYDINIERYVIEECIRGDLDKGTTLEVYCSYNGRFRQFAKDMKREISRHSIELGCQAPERDYAYDKNRYILLLNNAGERGIYTHKFRGLTLAVGWRDELSG